MRAPLRCEVYSAGSSGEAVGTELFGLSCVPGENGPEEFYIRLGFEFTGEIDEGEKIYRIAL